MMDKQNRNNAGKPKLTYWHFNRDALLAMHEMWPKVQFANFSASAITDRISNYLLGEDSELVVAGCLLMARVRADYAEECDPDPNGYDPAKVEFCYIAEHGADEYGNWNFVQGDFVCAYLDSALRHLEKMDAGELVDVKSGRLHAGHALWNVMVALCQPAWRDDRACKRYPNSNIEPKPIDVYATLANAHVDQGDFPTVEDLTEVTIGYSRTPDLEPPSAFFIGLSSGSDYDREVIVCGTCKMRGQRQTLRRTVGSCPECNPRTPDAEDETTKLRAELRAVYTTWRGYRNAYSDSERAELEVELSDAADRALGPE